MKDNGNNNWYRGITRWCSTLGSCSVTHCNTGIPMRNSRKRKLPTPHPMNSKEPTTSTGLPGRWCGKHLPGRMNAKEHSNIGGRGDSGLSRWTTHSSCGKSLDVLLPMAFSSTLVAHGWRPAYLLIIIHPEIGKKWMDKGIQNLLLQFIPTSWYHTFLKELTEFLLYNLV